MAQAGGLIPALELDHVGIAVEAADRSPLVAALGSAALELVPMPSGVAVGRFGPDRRLELVVPDRDDNPIARFLERRGPGLHHIAFRVQGTLAALLPQLEAAGLTPVGPIEPASDGRLCVFLHPSTTGGVLVELIEEARR